MKVFYAIIENENLALLILKLSVRVFKKMKLFFYLRIFQMVKCTFVDER